MASEENKIQKAGLDYCESHPIVKRIARTQSGKVKVKGGWMNLCPTGTPDTMGFTIDGRHIGIGYKDTKSFSSKDHGAKPEQIEHLLDIINAGGLAGIACCNEHVELILAGAPVGLDPFLAVEDDREQLGLLDQ
jgi:hypothetical protein